VEQDGEVRWATARVLLFSKHPDGRVTQQHDHGLISAYGSTPWHHEDAVFELAPDGGEMHLSLEHLGTKGSLQLRNVEVSVVRQRAWFVPVATALVILWVAWAACWTAPLLGRWKWLRAVLAGATLVGATWFAVFPQPRFSARSLVGQFQLGEVVTPSAPPAKTPEPKSPPSQPPPVAVVPPAPVPPGSPPPVQPPSPPVTATPPVVVAPPPAPPAPAPPPEPEKRETRLVDEEIRHWRDQFNFLHLAAFSAFGLAFFSFARPRAWPIAAVIAFASEALPNYQQHQAWDRGDIGDLTADATGLLLGAVVVMVVRKWWRKKSAPTGASISGDSTPDRILPG